MAATPLHPPSGPSSTPHASGDQRVPSSLERQRPPADLQAAESSSVHYSSPSRGLEQPPDVVGKSAPPFVESGGEMEKVVSQDGKETEVQPIELQEDDYPDGGLRAWLVVIGAWSVSFVSYGQGNSWSVFQSYYRENQLSNSSQDAVAWIGSLQVCLILGVGIAVGRAFDHGYLKLILAVGAAIYGAGLFSLPHCTEYWHFFLAHGVACGLGSGIAFLPALACISHWWRRRRAAALGIFSSGAAVGGVVYPIMLRNLFQTVGFAWAIRSIAFLTLGLLLFATLALKQRLPPRQGGRFIDLRVFADPVYSLLAVGAGLMMAGFYIPILLIQPAAISSSISPSISYYCAAILSGVSAVGRIAPNYLADSVGVLNILVINSALTTICCFLFYPMLKSDGATVAFCVLLGFASGCQVSIIPPCIASITKNMQEIGIRISMCYLVLAVLALPGPPVAGLIVSHTGSYLGAACLAGGLAGSALGLFIWARAITARRRGTVWV